MAFLKSKEFYELLDQFERDYKTHGYTRLEREQDKTYWERGIYFQHGDTNLAFKWYLMGYQTAKNIYQP